MITLIYKKPVPSSNEGNLVLKDFKCEVELIDSVTISLRLIDSETKEEKKEVIELSEPITSIDNLEEYLLTFNYFYKK